MATLDRALIVTTTSRLRRPRFTGLAGLAAVVGPGLLAGLSDDDPAGITTYSVLGTDYGYTFLWVLAVSTIALVLFQDLGARIGVVTGQGLAGLIRQRYGARAGVLSITALFVANVGTTTAEPRLRIAGTNAEWLVWVKLGTLKEAWQKPLRW